MEKKQRIFFRLPFNKTHHKEDLPSLAQALLDDTCGQLQENTSGTHNNRRSSPVAQRTHVESSGLQRPEKHPSNAAEISSICSANAFQSAPGQLQGRSTPPLPRRIKCLVYLGMSVFRGPPKMCPPKWWASLWFPSKTTRNGYPQKKTHPSQVSAFLRQEPHEVASSVGHQRELAPNFSTPQLQVLSKVPPQIGRPSWSSKSSSPTGCMSS